MQLENKRVLLTGASGGIGKEVARALEGKGASLILVARNLNKLQAVKNSLENPDKHLIIAEDLSTQEGVENLNQHCLSLSHQGQRIDVLINNAGSNQFNFLAQRHRCSIEHEIQLNLTAPIVMCQSSIAWINRPGIILNIGSTFGSIGYPGFTIYCAAKSGLQRFSEALDRELDGSGMRTLYLAPRATNTSLNSRFVNQLNKELGNKSDSPDIVAVYVVDVLEKEKTASWIGWPEKLFARLNQIFPTVVSHSIRKQQQTIHQLISQEQGKSS